jgi:hypothetical protein
MAGLTLVGIGGCLLSRQLDRPREAKGKRAASFAISFVEPLSDLLRRYGPALIVILVLVAIYRLPDFVSGVMAIPLYIDLGFTKSDIATVSNCRLRALTHQPTFPSNSIASVGGFASASRSGSTSSIIIIPSTGRSARALRGPWRQVSGTAGTRILHRSTAIGSRTASETVKDLRKLLERGVRTMAILLSQSSTGAR